MAYCRLVTMSSDNIVETNEYRSGVDAHWPFLSDARRVIQKDLDIAEYTDPLPRGSIVYALSYAVRLTPVLTPRKGLGR